MSAALSLRVCGFVETAASPHGVLGKCWTPKKGPETGAGLFAGLLRVCGFPHSRACGGVPYVVGTPRRAADKAANPPAPHAVTLRNLPAVGSATFRNIPRFCQYVPIRRGLLRIASVCGHAA